MKVSTSIWTAIERIPVGEPFTTSGFLALGTRASVDQTLSRLVKTGSIARVARGVYVRPKKNRFVGALTPEPLKIAQAIATSSGTAVQVQGAEAARRLGLTTQVPTRPVFTTTGPSRRLRVGNLRIELRHASPRKLRFPGSPVGLALAALWHLGRRGVTAETILTIRSRLSPADFNTLKDAAADMPAWMSDAFRRFERAAENA